jgi:MFS family permease
MMTVMAGATIAPSLPEMKAAFPNNPSAETLVKLILTIPGLFIAISAPISGWIIDRYGRIKLLVTALLLYGIGGTSGLYLNTLAEIIVGRALLGIAVGGIMTTAVALIGDYFDGPQRQSFLGVQASIMALSGTLFITLGGALADISWRYPFLIYALAFIAVPLVLIFLKEPVRDLSVQTNTNAPKAKIPKLTWTIYALSFIGMTVFYMMPVQVPFLVKNIGVTGNAEAGYALGTVMLVGGTVSFNFKRIKDRLTHYQIYGVSFLAIGLGYAILNYATSYVTLFPGLIIAGIGSGLIMPNSNLCLVSMAPPAVRGRVLGLLTTFFFMGQFLSPIIFQPLVDASSISESFLYLGILLAVLALISLIRNRRLVPAS